MAELNEGTTVFICCTHLLLVAVEFSLANDHFPSLPYTSEIPSTLSTAL